jgi:hypothetical protein
MKMKKNETESSILSARYMQTTLDSSMIDLNSSVRENLKFDQAHPLHSSMLIRDALEDELDV